MTATEIIAEIRNLPPPERREVLLFLRRLDGQRSGEDLARLADELPEAAPEAVERLKEAISQGFYGTGANAKG